MGEVADLVGTEGAASAGMIRPAEDARFEEGAIKNQLTAAFEQVKQTYFAFRAFELVLLLHGQPRHSPTFGGHRVTRAGQSLLLHEELLARRLPLLWRHDFGRVLREVSFRGLSFSFLSPLYILSRTRPLAVKTFSNFADVERQNSFRRSRSSGIITCWTQHDAYGTYIYLSPLNF